MMEHIVPSDPDCLFCKIVAGKIPSKLVYQDDEISACARSESMSWRAAFSAAFSVGLGRMMALVPKLALQEGCNPYPDGGFRILSNTGDEGRQEVHHLHIHVMGGPRPWLKG